MSTLTTKNTELRVLRTGASAAAALAGLVLLAGLTARAGAQSWIGPTTGSLNWSTAGNWTAGDIPDTPGALAVINDVLTGDRTITTPAGGLTMTRLTWNYNVGATGVDTIKLGGDVFMDDNSLGANRDQYFQITNSGTAANMVVDLNGHTLTLEGGLNFNTLLTSKVTLTSSAAGGKYVARIIGAMDAGTVIGPNVTVRMAGSGGSTFLNGTWDSTSVLEIATTSTTMSLRPGAANFGPTGPGYLRIGDAANATATNALMNLVNGQVQHDVTILGTTTPGVFSTIGWRGPRELAVGGSFIDYATGSLDYDYYPADPTAHGTIVFNRNPVTEQTVSIGRTGLTKTGFRVGNGASDVGKIVLGQDLTTLDAFAVTTSSLLNVADKTLTAGTVTIQNGSILTFWASNADTGRIAVTGANSLALGDFTLNLVRTGNWDYLHDLVLFTYTGTDIAVPTMTIGSVPGGFSYGQLKTDGGVVRLTNVGLPEPATAVLILVGGFLLGGTRSRVRIKPRSRS